MTKDSTKVRVIVAPDFGGQLRTLPMDAPLWVADTPLNKPFIKQMWAEKGSEITSFRVDEKAGAADWLVSVLGEVELHHGEYSQSPYTSLRVSGTGLSTQLRRELESYGFNTFVITPDGFVANRVAA